MRNWRRTALALLLGTIFLPMVMNRHEEPPGCGTTELARHGPTIQAVATAFAEGEEWAVETVEAWETAGRPGEIATPPAGE